jgi:transcription elongation factor GreB
MSKAFTKESDELPEPSLRVRAASPLPPGAKNYLTAHGAERLREEAKWLVEVERPKLMASLENSQEARQQVRLLDERVSHLQQVLYTATIVPVPVESDGRVRFGATVTVRRRGGEEDSYRIVGVDETDVEQNRVSWLSPIAKALINARVGERVRFRFPSGEEELEVTEITYAT